MSKIRLLGQCPGCGDKHLGIECNKPSYLTPTVTRSFCDNCESTILLTAGLPRLEEQRKHNQIAIAYQKIQVSEKLVQIMKAKQALDEATKADSEGVTPTTTEVQNATATADPIALPESQSNSSI
jgi:hypothetical protein